MERWSYDLETPLGPMRAAFEAHGRLAQLAFGALDPRATMPLAPRAVRDGFRFLERQLLAYFSGTLRTFTVPLEPVGTEFQRRVWDELLGIPFGATLTYRDVAQRTGHPNGVRAVGAAIGANPIAILVPCHRVIGSNGSLTGYAGGLEIKEKLLRLEGVLPAGLYD